MRETASKSGLLLSGCLRWAHPDSKWFQERPEDAKDREEGTEIHEAVHMYLSDLPYVSHARTERKIEAGIKYADELKPRASVIHTEKALGINIKTGESKLIDVQNRKYPKDDEFLYGTADIIAELVSGAILVADFKTGMLGDGADDQLKTLAYGASRIWNKPVRIAPVYLTDDGYISEEKDVHKSALDAHWNKITSALETVRKHALPLADVPGPHCTTMYCPHLAYCPSTQNDGNELVTGELTIVSEPTDWTEIPTSSKDGGKKAARIKAIKRAAEYHEKNLKDWIRAGNRAIWNGYEYKETGRGFLLSKVK